MASTEEYAKWIVNNADKKGTPEFDTVVKAYQQTKAQKPLTASEVATGAVTNFLPSVGNLFSSAYQAVTHPSETLGTMKDVATGLMQKVRNLSPEEYRGTAPAFDESKADALARMLKDRYGSIENVKRTVATDPAGILADASTVLTAGGAGAAKIPGMIGKIGEAAQVVGRTIEPIGATARAAGTVIKAVPREVLGFTTGAGGRAIEEAAKAGAQGGEAAEAFKTNIAGKENIATVVEDAKSALSKIKAANQEKYKSGMADIKADKKILKFDDIEKTVNDVKSRGFYKEAIKNPNAAEAWEKIDAAINEWKGRNPAEYHTPEGMDALKQKLADIQSGFLAPDKKPALSVATAVKNAVKDVIQKQAPTYAKVMADAEAGYDAVADLESSLSIGNKANIDTSIRKLQSILRNNANTNYGRRAELGDMLVASGADTLYPALAGQALSSWTPRAISGQGSLLGGLVTAAKAPTLLATAKLAPLLAVASPRAMGEAAYYTGKVAGTPQRLAEMLGKYGDKLAQSNPQMRFLIDYAKRAGGAVDPTIARLLAEQLGRMQQATE